MSIHKIGSSHIRLPQKADDVRDRSSKLEGRQGQSSADRGDTVEFSEEGLARAAELATENETAHARLMEIRERIDQGYYDRPDTALRIAERIVESGDLSTF